MYLCRIAPLWILYYQIIIVEELMCKQPHVTGHGGNNVLLLCILVGSLVYIET